MTFNFRQDSVVATFVFWSAIVVVAPAAFAQPAIRTERAEPAPRRLMAVRTNAPVRLDGVLDEEDWNRAEAASGFVQNEPREGDAATEDTDVKILYDTDRLYIGVFAHDRDPQGIIVNDLREDF